MSNELAPTFSAAPPSTRYILGVDPAEGGAAAVFEICDGRARLLAEDRES